MIKKGVCMSLFVVFHRCESKAKNLGLLNSFHELVSRSESYLPCQRPFNTKLNGWIVERPCPLTAPIKFERFERNKFNFQPTSADAQWKALTETKQNNRHVQPKHSHLRDTIVWNYQKQIVSFIACYKVPKVLILQLREKTTCISTGWVTPSLMSIVWLSVINISTRLH